MSLVTAHAEAAVPCLLQVLGWTDTCATSFSWPAVHADGWGRQLTLNLSISKPSSRTVKTFCL